MFKLAEKLGLFWFGCFGYFLTLWLLGMGFYILVELSVWTSNLRWLTFGSPVVYGLCHLFWVFGVGYGLVRRSDLGVKRN
jgi:hypothetical protein